MFDDILHVDLDLTSQWEALTEIKGFFTSTGNDTSDIWHFIITVFLHLEVFNGLKDLGDVTGFIDLLWFITVGKDIQKIIDGQEEESWESVLLGTQEVHQGLFAKVKITLGLFESLHQVLG
jgi:hypothetical protein